MFSVAQGVLGCPVHYRAIAMAPFLGAVVMRFLTMEQVSEITTLSPTEINRRIEAGTFPAPVRISKHPRGRKAFPDFVIEEWCRSWLT
jgi:predicted DNA-binding transcriptional regulator AlpA